MIYGERIRFRHTEKQDLPAFVEWLNDDEVRKGISLYLPMSMAREEQWYEEMMKRPPEEHPLVVEAREGEGWKMIGNCGFFDMNSRVRSAEVGIVIGDKSYWDRGYGTETMELLLQHGFDTLNLHRIFLRVYENNARAIRCYEKVGFVQEGRIREAEYQEGRYLDVIFMGVLRAEWAARQDEEEK